MMGWLEDICSELVKDYTAAGKCILQSITEKKEKVEKSKDYKEIGRLKKEIRQKEANIRQLKKESDKKKTEQNRIKPWGTW
jgi:cell division protein FtsB